MTTPTKALLFPTARTTRNAFILAVLLAASAIPAAWAGSREEDKARGEALLRQAHLDMAQVRQLSDAAAIALATAQRDEQIANRKRLQAHALERAAFLLIRDSRRMEASELRTRAEAQEQQVKSEQVELLRLQGLLADQKQLANDTSSAAAKIRDAAANEPSPAEKAQLGNMAATLNEQAATANNEAAALEGRIQPVQAEINRLNASITDLNQKAQALAPAEM